MAQKLTHSLGFFLSSTPVTVDFVTDESRFGDVAAVEGETQDRSTSALVDASVTVMHIASPTAGADLGSQWTSELGSGNAAPPPASSAGSGAPVLEATYDAPPGPAVGSGLLIAEDLAPTSVMIDCQCPMCVAARLHAGAGSNGGAGKEQPPTGLTSGGGLLVGEDLVPAVVPIIGEGADDATGGGGSTLGGIAGKFGNTEDPTAASGPNLYTLLNLQQNPDGSYYFTGDRNVDAILIGSKWQTLNLTYSFPTGGGEYPASGYNGDIARVLLELGTNQKAAALAAFGMLSGLTNLTFSEAAAGTTAIIRIAQTGDSTVGSAQGQFASDHYAAGDIFFGRTSQPYYDWALKGSWGFATMMHEIGHTMGLKHGHQDYTTVDLSFYFGSAPRYGTRALETAVDGQSYSLMTYSLANGDNSHFGGDKINQPQSYMQFDIAALQYLYGANFNTNSGATTYSWNATTGEMSINGVGQGAPTGNKILMTLWDGGGVDTYDLSNYATGISIDLRPGAFSTFSPDQLANHGQYSNLLLPASGEVANALLYNNDIRSLIENAIGGAGNDTMVGNAADNVLTGNGGDDVLVGGLGNDRLEGGAGSDTAVFSDSATGITVTLDNGVGDIVVVHGAETDTLNQIENIVGTAYADTLTGDNLNNRLEGGGGGADTLTGGAGDDQLIGGGFAVVYDTSFSAPDITKAQTTVNNSRATAVLTAGTFDVQANANITNDTTTPHTTINATAAGGGLEYYRVDVTQSGQTAIFDIDTGTTGTLTDSWINLYDSAGALLATNDFAASVDPGSVAAHDDSYLTYTFTTPGTYYIAVGQYAGASVAQALTAGQTYTLNISLSGSSAPQLTNNTSSAVLDGGAGNDLLQGTLGNDTISGGADNDTASYVTTFSSDATGVTVNLNSQGAAQDTVRAGSDTLTGIENLIGSAYNDTLTGDGGNNVIEGGAGADTLDGQGGSDTASYAGATSGVTVSLGLQGGAQNTIGAGTDTLTGFENLLGSAFADSLTGDGGANRLDGGAGDDILNGFAVDASGPADTLVGGLGSDTASFAGYTGNITASLVTLNATDGVSGNTLATFNSIENLTGGSGNDTLTGDTGANTLAGGAGNDSLSGGGGDDRLEGGLGDDSMDGGAGANDTAVFSGTGAVTANLTTGVASGSLGNDTLTGIENLQGGSGVDTFTGDGNSNIFYDVGGAAGTATTGGADSYNGAGGSDTVSYELSTAGVTVNLTLTTSQNANTGGDILTSIENVIGTASGDILLGSAAANTLTGNAGVDRLQGEAGADTLFGGDGNDILFGDSNGAFSTSDGADVLDGGAGFDQLVGGAGNDLLRGGDGDDTLVGGLASSYSGGNQLGTAGTSLTQAFTNDGGQDTFEGGEGTDIAYAYYTDQTGAVTFNLSNIQGNSGITLGGVAAGYFDSIERVIWRGGLGDDVVTGTGFQDTLIGNAGNDTISGFLGDDVISGDAGNDILDGGEGLDTLTFVNATAGITVDLRITAAQTTGQGSDTISNFEYVVGSGFADTIKGTDDFNLLTDGAFTGVTPGTSGGGNDSIYGYGGDDMILVNRATTDNANTPGNESTATTVLMDGGDGNDIIEFRAGTMSATPLVAGTGNNQSGGLGLSGSTVLNLNTRGTRFIDTLTVNAGNGDDRVVLTAVLSATIDLGAGADTLAINMQGTSSQSNYAITTGTGADIIQLNANALAASTTAHTSTVTDFTRGDLGDKFELTDGGYLSSSVLSSYGAGSDPFAGGYLQLLQSGTDGHDLLLQVDRDGVGASNSFVTLFTLNGAYTGGFTAFNFDGFSASLNVTGFATGETITGDAKADTIDGAGGDDTLIGNGGADTLTGGTGDDILRGGAGGDSLNGGANTDTADYGTSLASVTVNLLAGTASGGDAAGDILTSIENLTGSASADTLTGDGGANVLIGGAGDDVLTGGAANDTLVGGAGTDTAVFSGLRSAYTVTQLSNGDVQLVGPDGTDTTTSVERFIFDDGAYTVSTIGIVNHAPSGTDGSVSGFEDRALVIGTSAFGFSDTDNNALAAVKIMTLPTAGTLFYDADGAGSGAPVAVTANQSISAADITAGKLTYLGASNASGTGYASFTFQVQDNGGTANGGVDTDPSPNTLTINLTAVNDAPVASASSVTTNEDTVYAFKTADFPFTDVESNALFGVIVTSLPAAGSLTLYNAAVTPGQLIFASDISAGHLLFTPAANANGTGYASFGFKVQDNGGTDNGGADTSGAFTFTVNVTPVNDAPSGINGAVSGSEDRTLTLGVSDFGFTDVESNALAAVKITTLATAGALFYDADGAGGADPVAVTLGQSISAADITAGKLTYLGAANASGTGYASFTFQVQDNGGTSNDGVDLDPSANTLTVNLAAVNDAPVASASSVTTIEDSAYTFALADFSFTDVESNAFSNLIVASLPLAGTLTLNSVAVTAGQSIAAGEITAGHLVFTPAANGAGAAYASFTFQVQDNGGTANGGSNTSAAATLTVNVTAVNDSPVLASTLPSLANENEDAPAPTDGQAVGTLVSALVGGESDVDSGALKGIAVTYNAGRGVLWYSLDNGATWQTAGTVSDAHALLLPSNVNARIYLQASGDLNGTDVAFSFRAWDQTSGTAGGYADTSGALSGGATAFSSATDNAVIYLAPVNDAPTVVGATATLTSISEDAANPAGDTVANLFGGHFLDDADDANANQTNAGDGSDANLFAGVAISANAATATQGAWQYSLDAGATWTALPTVSNAAALVLAQKAKLRFVPAANFNGAAPSLTAHLIDDSSALHASPVDLTSTGTGGTTPYSSATVALSETISAVNDAPTVSAPTAYAGAPGAAVAINGLTFGDVDGGSSAETVTFTVGAGVLAATSSGSVTIAGSGTGALTATGTIAALNAYFGAGTSNLTFTGSTEQTLGININDQGAAGSGGAQNTNASPSPHIVFNRAPAAPTDSNTGANTVAEGAAVGTAVGVTAAATDPDTGDTVTYSLTNSANGAFQINATTGVVTVADPSKIDYESTSPGHALSITVQASDGVLTSTQTFSIGVTNVAPTAPADANAAANSVTEGASAGTAVGITAASSDVNGGAVTYALTTNPGGFFQIDATTGVVTVSAAGAAGINYETAPSHAYTVTVRAADSSLATSTTTDFTIAVADVAPVGVSDSYSVDEDTTLTVTAPGVVQNDTDLNGGPLTAVLVAGPSHASAFTLNADGSFSYKGAANYNGADSFTYTVSDGSAAVGPVTVNLTINPVNDAPTAVADAASVTQRLTTSGGVLGNDSDVDQGDSLSVTAVAIGATSVAVAAGAAGTTLAGVYGHLTLHRDGTYAYVADAEGIAVGQVVTDTFTYTASDGHGGSATAALTVTVTGSADASGDNNDHTVIGSGSSETIKGGGGSDRLDGGGGDDVLTGGGGADTLTGGSGSDTFRDSRSGLNGDTITDLSFGEKINVTDADLGSLTYTRVGGVLTLTNGAPVTINLSNNPSGHLVLATDANGGVDLILGGHVTNLTDFNGDGHTDLLWRNVNNGTFTTWSTTGNFQGNAEQPNTYVNGSVDNSWQIQGTFDFNGDGVSDLLWRNVKSGVFTVWTGSSSGFVQNAYVNSTVDTGWTISALGDFNGDGKDDLLFRHVGGGLTEWASIGTGFTPNTFGANIDSGWHIQGVGDFNGDGKDDLIWRNDNGSMTEWQSSGDSFVLNTYGDNSVSKDWHIAQIADFNGDGKADILWRNDNGQITEWQSSGNSFIKNVYSNGSVDNSWHLVGTGDFNDDGKADLIWRNDNGVLTTWQSTGDGFDQTVLSEGRVGSDWVLVTHHYDFV